MSKILSWVIAFCGLWEFGDIAAVFVPDFGRIPVFLWNHILVGALLIVAGAWAALTRNARTARNLHWSAAAAGIWLAAAAFLLRWPKVDGGLWNDVIVGGIVLVCGVWAALRSPRAGGSG